MTFRVKKGQRPSTRFLQRGASRVKLQEQVDTLPTWAVRELPLAAYIAVYVALDVWIAWTGESSTEEKAMPYDPVLLSARWRGAAAPARRGGRAGAHPQFRFRPRAPPQSYSRS